MAAGPEFGMLIYRHLSTTGKAMSLLASCEKVGSTRVKHRLAYSHCRGKVAANVIRVPGGQISY